MPDQLSHTPPDDPQALEALQAAQTAITAQLERRVFGQGTMIEELLVALVARGHAIFVGVPGLAKTLIVQSLADATALEFGRIQFTPDLMPADITGTEVLDVDPATNEKAFRFVPGPVFANLLLADEINRTPPKTQAALLQAMQEGRVHAGGRAHQLPEPFHGPATRHPIEQDGTSPLPEAQLDRFMLEIEVRYPERSDEERIITLDHRRPATVDAVLDAGPISLALAVADLEQKKQTAAKLAGIYHKGQSKIWDGKSVLPELIAKHGGINLPSEKVEAIQALFAVILWGELAAWKISADLCNDQPLDACGYIAADAVCLLRNAALAEANGWHDIQLPDYAQLECISRGNNVLINKI